MLWSPNSKIYADKNSLYCKSHTEFLCGTGDVRVLLTLREKKVILLNEVRHTNASSMIAFVWKVWTKKKKHVISANRRHDEHSPKGRMSCEIQKEVRSGDSLAMA